MELLWKGVYEGTPVYKKGVYPPKDINLIMNCYAISYSIVTASPSMSGSATRCELGGAGMLAMMV
jgi:hypothetical protein